MSTRYRAALVSLVLVAAILACNLPGRKSAPTPSEPTPNLTMTALFSIVTQQPAQPTVQQPSALPPVATATTAPQVVTATSAAPAATATRQVVQPSVTPAPTRELRPAGKAAAQFLGTAPTLDGIWDEWETTAYPAKFVVYGSAAREDKEDLEGSYRIGWDNTYLYLAVKVIDDIYAQNATGLDIYKGDSVELLLDIDLRGDALTQSLNSDDYQLVVSPGKPDTDDPKEAYLYYPSNVAGPRPQVKVAAVGGDGTYRVEIAIPWSVFGISPAAGQQYGFAVSMSDNDNENANEQQSMVSNVSGRSLTDPTTWAMVTLIK